MKNYCLQSTRRTKLKTQLQDWSTSFIDTQLNTEPFPKYERAKRVSHSLQMSPQNLVSDRWNHGHLDSLLKKSNASRGDSPVRTPLCLSSISTESKYPEIKNACKYGFTNVFPLVPKGASNIIGKMLTEGDCQVTLPEPDDNSDCIEHPLSPQQRLMKMHKRRCQMQRYKDTKARKTNNLRLKLILQGGYPHGVQGVENPESKERSYCPDLQQQVPQCVMQITFNEKRRLRANLIHQKFNQSNLFNAQPDYTCFPKQTFDLSPLMKSKKHVRMMSESCTEDFPKGGKRMNIRPSSLATYNIINNLQND